MQEAIVALVDELMEAVPLPDAPYMELHWCLLTSHYADRHQRVEQLISMPSMAAQKTSKLPAEMNCLCPRGQEINAFFLIKLTRQLHILFSEVDKGNKQALGTRAGIFWVQNRKMAHDVVATFAATFQLDKLEKPEEESRVVTVQPGTRKSNGSQQRGGGIHGWEMPEQSVTSGTRLTLMPESQCRTEAVDF